MKDNLFEFVISFFATWGWQALGKIPDPVSGKTQKNIEMANNIIEILTMLEVKTKGNLTEEEARILRSTITDLQLNYVDELKKEQKKEENGKTDKEQTEKNP
ncbi:MAG TPA: DUF1844 domain-containing protein [Candidatus Ratteibacteria bacterium]|nr:DUF1844 domain-containing protein [Candidatus Ratteibacteria bacterium]